MAKHKGLFKQPGSGFWWVRYAGIDGRIIRQSTKTDKFKDAVTFLEDRKKEVRDGLQPEAAKRIQNHLFYELTEKYTAWIEGRQHSAKTKGYIIGQLKTTFGNLPLRRFNTIITEQLQTDLMKRGLKNTSINKVLNVLKHLFTKAIEWEMVEAETLKRIRKVKPLRDDSKRLRFLSKEECKALLENCHGYLKTIVIFALNTGCRRGEILSLKWENVDLKHGFIRLERTKNGERRDIPINDDLKAVLQVITRRLDVPHVFFDNATGKAYKDVKRSFSTALKKAEVEKCTKCDYQQASDKTQNDIKYCPQCNSEMAVFKGIKDFHFHDLRHTFASHLVMAGVDITTVSKLLGHKGLTMTLRYSHFAPNHLQNAVNMLNLTGEEKRTAYLLHSLGN